MQANSVQAWKWGRLATHIVLIAGACTMIVPFIWMLLTSFKTMPESIHVPPTIFPRQWAWANYLTVWNALPFGSLYFNSAASTVVKTVGQLFLSSMAAYAFARIRFAGRSFLFVLCLSVLMIPGQVFIIPQYLIMKHLGLLNSLGALIVPGLFSAMSTFFLRQFFMTLPRELDESARLDGCNHWTIYWRIMLPLCQAGLIAQGIFIILWSWNDLMWPLIVNTSTDKMTLTAGLSMLQGQYFTSFPDEMAGTLLSTIPMIIVFIILQRQFIEGIQLTGSKG